MRTSASCEDVHSYPLVAAGTTDIELEWKVANFAPHEAVLRVQSRKFELTRMQEIYLAEKFGKITTKFCKFFQEKAIPVQIAAHWRGDKIWLGRSDLPPYYWTEVVDKPTGWKDCRKVYFCDVVDKNHVKTAKTAEGGKEGADFVLDGSKSKLKVKTSKSPYIDLKQEQWEKEYADPCYYPEKRPWLLCKLYCQDA
ncbi:unnamed protein product, partial [Amoebophrya sp. A120]|eukprot:GSA120T00003257001.1